jgi:hypothetical protein
MDELARRDANPKTGETTSGPVDVRCAGTETESFGFSDEPKSGVEPVGAIIAMTLVREQLDLVATSSLGICQRSLKNGSCNAAVTMLGYDNDSLDERGRGAVVREIRHPRHRGCPDRFTGAFCDVHGEIWGGHHSTM